MKDMTINDLRSAVFALEGWLDAFGDDPDWEEEAVRVRRAYEYFDELLGNVGATEKKARHLKIVGPSDESES